LLERAYTHFEFKSLSGAIMSSRSAFLRSLKIFATSASIWLLAACGGGGSDNSSAVTPPVTNPSTLSGTVLDAAGTPVAGASVVAGSQNVITPSDGSYSLRFDASSESAVVLVKKVGYTTTAKEVPLASGSNSKLNLRVYPDQVTRTFSASSGINLSVNGATVVIAANALKSDNGNAYTGTVNVAASYYSPDTLQGVQAFAGPYSGTDAGVSSPIISAGFMEVKLTDSAGNPLQLKAGSPATLTFPASSNSGNATSIPLWFYDEALKTWVREGTATRQANGTYTGTVTHFTLWNVDFPGLVANIQGCFVNAAGVRLSDVGAIVGLRTTGWTRWFTGRLTNGEFFARGVPANVALELYSGVSPASFAPVAIPALAPGETRQLPCIVATASSSNELIPPSTIFVPPSTPNDPGTASFAGAYSGTFIGSETGTFNVSVTDAGLVGGTSTPQSTGVPVPVNGTVSNNGSVSLTASGSAGNAVFTGSIASNGSLSGTWGYPGGIAGAGGTFSGQRTVVSSSLNTYVGNWAGCLRQTDGSSVRVISLRYTLASASVLSFSETAQAYSSANCSGSPVGDQFTFSGTATANGTKQVGAVTADRFIVAIAAPFNDVYGDILNTNGTVLRGGDADGSLDANGYPNSFAIDTLAKIP
jgi:Carboxypeptidase regulatory-like domain